jgi:hypothetical protein
VNARNQIPDFEKELHAMRRAMLILCAVLLALAGAAFAADVSGKWTGDVSGPDGGSMTITYNFKQDGAKLTGTVEGPAGAIEIKDGKVDGDKISFTITFDAGGGDMKVVHEGTVKPEEIALNFKMEGGPGDGPSGPITLKRVK